MAQNGKHQGIKQEWLNLPSKRCLNCPKSFKPTRPDQKFCSDGCRWEFHRYGGAFVRIKDLIEPTVRKALQLEKPCPDCKGTGTVLQDRKAGFYSPTKVPCETCINGRVLTPFGRDVLALVTSGHVKEVQAA